MSNNVAKICQRVSLMDFNDVSDKIKASVEARGKSKYLDRTTRFRFEKIVKYKENQYWEKEKRIVRYIGRGHPVVKRVLREWKKDCQKRIRNYQERIRKGDFILEISLDFNVSIEPIRYKIYFTDGKQHLILTTNNGKEFELISSGKKFTREELATQVAKILKVPLPAKYKTK